MSEREALLAAARAVAAGLPVNWAAVEASVGDESLRAAIRELKVVAVIADLHSQAAATPPSPSSSSSSPSPWSPSSLPVTPTVSLPIAHVTDARRETWGPLTLLELVGRGSFGEVYRAWDPRLDREVALKLLRRDESAHHALGSAVIEEGRLLARIRHPNVVTVYGADRIDGRIGLWMEFVRGRTLEEVLQAHGPLAGHEAAHIGIDLCRALSAVHRAGLIHRDVKAQNVMREAGGRIVLMDFGAGREPGGPAGNGQPQLAGTPLYLAPEVCDGEPADARADIYSLGVLLYRLVTGTFPVNAPTFRDIRQAHHQGSKRRLRDERPDLPEPLIRVIERALEREPLQRFDSAGAMDGALSLAVAADLTVTPATPAIVSVPAPAVTGFWPGWHSARFWAAAGVLLAMVLAVSVVSGIWRGVITATAPPGDEASAPAAGSQLTGAVPPLTVKQVLLPGQYLILGRPSLDGRLYPFIDGHADVAVKELDSGRIRVLTTKGKSAEGGAGPPLISPDGRVVAYPWTTLDGATELRVIGIDGAWPRVLLRREDVDTPYPVEWSADGSHILLQLEMKGGTRDIALMSVADGTLRTVITEGTSHALGVTLSPDGRFVALDRLAGPAPSTRDIVVVAADGSGEWPVVQHPAQDMFPFWSPDGQRIFFTSDRTGSLGLWMVAIDNGRPLGDPTVLSRDMGRMTPLGPTRTGAFFFRQETGLVDVYTVKLNPVTGQVAGRPASIQPNRVGSNISSSWSRDGRLAYVKIQNPAGAAQTEAYSRTLAIRNTATGEDRDVWPALAFFIAPRWSPDGHTVLVTGVDLQTRVGLHRIDAVTGRVQPAAVVPVTDGSSAPGWPAWSPDGQSVLFGRGGRSIVSHDLATGRETTLVDVRTWKLDRLGPGGAWGAPYALSPDGASLAFSAWTGSGEQSEAIIDVMPLGGTPVEVFRSKIPVFLQDWTPDGLDLLFVQPVAKEGNAVGLWRVPAAGGAPAPMGLTMDGLRDVHISPDGASLTFTAGWQSGDVRVMEHFLPTR